MTDYTLLTRLFRRWQSVVVLRLSWLVLLGTGILSMHAQQDVAFLQYWNTETLWNPAAVGRSPQITINGAIQSHASGFDDAGSTMWAGADMAFDMVGARHGVGASFLNDEIGLFSHKRFAIQYALHRRLWGGTLSLGVQADMLQEGIDGSKADFGDGSDPAFPTSEVTGSAFDLSAGLSFARKQLQLGLSVQHITAPAVAMGETHQYEIKRGFNFMGAYNIKLNSPFYTVTPSAMLRTDLTDYRVDLSLRGQYQYEKRRILAGLNYAPGRSVGVFVGGTLRGIDVGYSYEAFTSGLGLGAGQHEISIAYRLDLNLGKKGRNLHKSVRWL